MLIFTISFIKTLGAKQSASLVSTCFYHQILHTVGVCCIPPALFLKCSIILWNLKRNIRLKLITKLFYHLLQFYKYVRYGRIWWILVLARKLSGRKKSTGVEINYHRSIWSNTYLCGLCLYLRNQRASEVSGSQLLACYIIHQN